MLHLRPVVACLAAGIILLFLYITPYSYGRSHPLFYVTSRSLACDTSLTTKHLYHLKAHHNALWEKISSLKIKQGHCFTLLPDQLWERHETTQNLTFITGVSPQTIEAAHLYIPSQKLHALKPSLHSLSISSATKRNFSHARKTLPVDLPLVILEVFLVWRSFRFFYRRHKAWTFLRTLIYTHQETLFQRRHQLLIPNRYGKISTKRWNKEKDLFCQTILYPALHKHHLSCFWSHWEKRAYHLIDVRSAPATSVSSKHSLFEPPDKTTPAQEEERLARMTPGQYERYCAYLLQKAGWNTYVTPQGSDQGADVIATRNKVRLIVQCKLYSRPVGNKAVQEIFTACQHQNGQIAAVVSNASYTRHARQLAESTGVYLLHHRQLSSLDESTPQPGQASFL